MKIVVVGDGKVGFAIAKQLNQEGHDITGGWKKIECIFEEKKNKIYFLCGREGGEVFKICWKPRYLRVIC